MRLNTVKNNENQGSRIPIFSLPILLSFLVLIYGSIFNVQAQSNLKNPPPVFRKSLDYVAMSPVFNQANMSLVESTGKITFQPLLEWNQYRVFRRTRILTLPRRIWVPFKHATLDGDSGVYKEKKLRIWGRLITATDSGAWIYQPKKKRVAYVPYSQTATIKSGSSTVRSMYLAILPVAAEIATWVALDDYTNVDVFGHDQIIIGGTVVLGTAFVDFMLWAQYMDKKRHSPLFRLHINGSSQKGLIYKGYAEGTNLFVRAVVRKTSVNVALFPKQYPAY